MCQELAPKKACSVAANSPPTSVLPPPAPATRTPPGSELASLPLRTSMLAPTLVGRHAPAVRPLEHELTRMGRRKSMCCWASGIAATAAWPSGTVVWRTRAQARGRGWKAWIAAAATPSSASSKLPHPCFFKKKMSHPNVQLEARVLQLLCLFIFRMQFQFVCNTELPWQFQFQFPKCSVRRPQNKS